MARRLGRIALLLYYPGSGMPRQDRSYERFGERYGLDAAFIEFILPRVFPGMTEADRHDDCVVADADRAATDTARLFGDTLRSGTLPAPAITP